MPKLRIIGYGRESTKDQAINGFNLDDQEKKIRKYVSVYYEKGTYKFTMMRDEGASAKSLSRPKMDEIIAMVKKKQVDVIIIHNLDRLTRQVRDLATLLELFEANDVSLISITEKIDTKSAMGRFFIYLIVLVAQWEWETIKSRSKRGIEESARQGNYALPGAPFGYQRDPEDNHKLIIKDEEAGIVKRIFESIAKRDYSVKELRNTLNSEKVLGKKWTDDFVERILNNKIYYGTFTRFGIEYSNHTIPIINEELFNLAHERLSKKMNSSKRQRVYDGLVVCDKCGDIMTNHTSKSSTGRIHDYYRCRKCRIQVSEKSIDEHFVGEFDHMLRNQNLNENLQELTGKYEEMGEIIDTIPKSAFTYDMNIKHLVELYSQCQTDKDAMDYCLRRIKVGLKKSKFTELTFVGKREFLLGHIKAIRYTPASKDLEIEYIDSSSHLENKQSS